MEIYFTVQKFEELCVRPMSLHDIHQYYFEKYLRNEMPDTDRKAFEEKMAEDPALKKSFEYYQKNRKQFLEDLLIEQDESDKQHSLNSWIYLLISLTGIILAVNFYLENRELKAAQTSKHVPFYKHIPFIFKKETKEANQEKGKKLLAAMAPVKENEEIVSEDSEEIASEQDLNTDKLLYDSFILAGDGSNPDLRYYTSDDNTYALVVDSLPQEFLIENPGQSKVRTVFVEFWQSPVNYHGYMFNGKKLVLYGISAPFDISLVTAENIMILRHKEMETPLLADGEFHKF